MGAPQWYDSDMQFGCDAISSEAMLQWVLVVLLGLHFGGIAGGMA